MAILQPGTNRKISRITIDNWNIDIWEKQGRKYCVKTESEDKILFGSRGNWKVYELERRHQQNLRRKKYVSTADIQRTNPARLALLSLEPGYNIHQVIATNYVKEMNITQTHNPLINTFDSHLANIDKNLPWAWEEVYGPRDMQNILKAIHHGTLYAVSDGSYLDGIGTSASILDDRNGDEFGACRKCPAHTDIKIRTEAS